MAARRCPAFSVTVSGAGGLDRAAVRESAARRLRVLGHSSRLRIVERLARGSATVSELAAVTDLATSTVSKHLRELASVHVVAREQHGNFARYSLTDDDTATLVALAYRGVARQSKRHRATARRYLTESTVAANRRR